MVPRMSVGDMVGQMFVVSVGGTQPDYYIEKMVRERNIGGVILFGYNMKSEEQVESLTSSLQRLSMQTEPAVPLFVAVDQEGGDIASAPWVTPQPAAAEVGSRGDPERGTRHRRHDGSPAPAGRHQHELRARRRHGLRGRDRQPFLRGGPRTGGQDGGCGRRGIREGRRGLGGQALPEPRSGDLRLARGPARHKARREDPQVLRPAAIRGRRRRRGAYGDGRASPLPGHRPRQIPQASPEMP